MQNDKTTPQGTLSTEQVRTLLTGIGDPAERGWDPVVSDLYEALRGLARRHLQHERSGHTWQPTELVHEAWLRLNASFPEVADNRSQCLAIASRLMRQVLVDHARHRKRDKRGGGVPMLTFTESGFSPEQSGFDSLLEVDRLLEDLERRDPAQCRIVECRVFGGMSIEETAMALRISDSTVKRHWRFARAWLLHELNGDEFPP